MLIEKEIINGLLNILNSEYTNKKKDSEKGVWRYIRGNRVFIRDGETVAEAFARRQQYTKDKSVNNDYKSILKKVAEDNKKEIDNSQLIENAVKNSLKPLDIKEVKRNIESAKHYNDYIYKNNLETFKLHSDGKGNYTPERKELHNKILNDIFANTEKAKPNDGEKPTLVALGGRGGSGKSKFNGLVYNKDNYIVLDADAIKEQLPEYMGYNAFEVHEESSDILSKALKQAQDMGLNVVLDATMKSLGSTEKKIQSFVDAGYDVEMYYMHLPRETASERAIGRFMGDRGRYVPLEVLQGMKDNEANFDKLKHYAKKWAFYNNNVPSPDDEPIFVAGNV